VVLTVSDEYGFRNKSHCRRRNELDVDPDLGGVKDAKSVAVIYP